MFACDPLYSRRAKGFSLVELLVALLFTSMLMAGMTKVFTATVSSFSSNMESTAIQRNARWALNLLQNDVMQVGYLMPPRVVSDLIGNTQPPLMIETTGSALDRTLTDGTHESIAAPDELQVVMDVPLEVGGTLAVATVGSNQMTINFTQGRELLQAGDLVYVKDSAFELFKTSSVPGTTGVVSLASTSGLLDAYGNDTSNSMVSPQVMKTHLAGAELGFVRPLQVVSYTLQLLNLDPGNKDATVPCLVRRTRSLSGSFGTPELMMEGVTQFSLDWSLDGGATWVRKANSLTSSRWTQVQAATSTAFASLATKSTLAASLQGGMGSTSDPFWFNYVPVLMKVDVETRTQLKRTEFSGTANQAAYRTRRETLMISPRNFALGAP